MKDEEYLFHSDSRDKKNIARSARNRRTHNGKSGRVRFPSDNMTKKELNKMNGEVKSYRLNEPMSWKEFKAMPDDIKVSYIKLIREKFDAPDKHIGTMMGTNVASFSDEMTRLGLNVGRRKAKKWDTDAFYAWVACVPTQVTETQEEEQNEESVEEIVPIVPEVPAVEQVIRNAIPDNGSMTFEGKIDEVLKTISVLLGGANVHISVTWDVLSE